MKKTFAIAAAALLAGSLAGMAQATTPVRSTIHQQVVSYADLNLENEADAAILLSRIESAARKVCGYYLTPVPIELQSNVRTCAKDATARAVADVNAPLLMRRDIVVLNIVE
jgi:UrcA family protein